MLLLSTVKNYFIPADKFAHLASRKYVV